MLNNTIDPMTISQNSSGMAPFDLLTPQIHNPPKQLVVKDFDPKRHQNGGGSTFEMSSANDYGQKHSLFSNREERKTTRFKKNNPSGERGYGK